MITFSNSVRLFQIIFLLPLQYSKQELLQKLHRAGLESED